MKVEHLMILLYLVGIVQCWFTKEPGKALYWLGAAILTVGILKMRG